MTDRRVRELLEDASAQVPARDLAESTWTAGQRARSRDRAMVIAGAAAVAAIVVTAIGTSQTQRSSPVPATQTSHEPTPTDATRTDPTRTDGTADAPRVPPPIDPTIAQPPFDPRAVDELPWRPSVLPRLPEPADLTPLAADPVTRAVAAAANEFDEEFDISVLGDDGRWRAVDTSGLDPDAAPNGDVVGMTSSSLSPDGTKIAISQPREVVVVDLTDATTRGYGTPGAGFPVAWTPDSTRLLVWGETRGTLIDIETGDTDPVPYGPFETAFTSDGAVVQTYHSKATSHELRRYEAGQLTHRVSLFPDGVDQYGILTGLSADDAVAAIREVGQSYGKYGLQDKGGVLVLSAAGDAIALLPIIGANNSSEFSSTLGWIDAETVLLRVADGHPVEFDGIHELVTWNYATGELTRVAQVRVDFVVSLAPTLLD